ncbi:MAG: Flp family type IVb pilin [Nitrospinae bacterium]|nr:Flp family type IVb pilin [Nitrospinota bacterium]
MVQAMVRFLKDEEGATAIEYGLIAALISVAIIIGAGAVGTAVNDTFNNVAGTMTGVGG